VPHEISLESTTLGIFKECHSSVASSWHYLF